MHARSSALAHDHDAAGCVVAELARDASQQEPLESVQASGAHDDEVGILLLRDLDDDVRCVPLARMCGRLDRPVSERATGARENGFGRFAQLDRFAACWCLLAAHDLTPSRVTR
jgi:hypothetical protein